MKSEVRRRQIESRLRQALGRFLLDYNDQAEVVKYINLIDIRISPDLAYAQVYYSLLDSASYRQPAELFFRQYGFKLRQRLAQRINLRITPELRFIYDDTEEKAWKIDQLLAAATKDLD